MMNRYRFLLILSLLAAVSPALRGQEERLRERVYVSTDREVYVAGDAVWMSAYCVDAVSGRLSTFSKTAYVEIHSPSGMVQTAKLALEGGRGAGRLTRPNTLLTGCSPTRSWARPRRDSTRRPAHAPSPCSTLSAPNGCLTP